MAGSSKPSRTRKRTHTPSSDSVPPSRATRRSLRTTLTPSSRGKELAFMQTATRSRARQSKAGEMANPDPKISQEELSSGGNTTSAPSSRQVPLRFGLTPIPELEESASDVRVDLHPGIAEATSPETNVTLSSAAADSALGEQTVSSPHTLVDSSPLANVSGEVALSDANIAQLPVTGDSPRREQVVSLPPEISAPSSPADIAGKPSLFDMNSASPPVAAGLVHREQTLSPSHDLDASPSPAGLAEAASLDANLALPVASSNPRETAPGADPSLPAPSGLAPPCHDLNQRSEEPSRRSTPSLKNSVLYAGFQEITAILRRLSTATKMPHEEVLACWTEYAEIPRTKSVNHWNVYCSYMKANPVQEIQRVDPSYNSSKPPGELLISMRQKCYDAFRSAYPDRWKTILDLFDSMQKQGKEVTSERERSRYFSRLLATLKNFATRYASLYGFEMLIVTGGNLESHDGPLLDMVTSPLAGEFIAKQLHISDDEMMKRFQNHIFAAYDGQFEEAASAPVIEGTNDSSALDSDHLLVESAPRASRRDRYDSEEVEVRNQQKTHFTRIQTIRNELRSRFIAAGGLFPTQGAWKKWPSLLARQGIVCRNWPAKVPWLGSDDVLHGNFSAGDQMAILSALKQQPNGLTFEKLDERHIPALCRGEQPVITRATPLNGAMYKIDGLYKACRTPMLEHTVQAETLPHVTKHGGDAITDPVHLHFSGAGHTDATVPEYTRSDSGAPTESYVPESGDPHGAQLPPLSTPLKRVASEEDLPGRKRQRTDSDDIDGVPMMETQNDSTTSVTGDHERNTIQKASSPAMQPSAERYLPVHATNASRGATPRQDMVKEPGSRVEMIDQRRTGYALEQADRRPSLVPKREMSSEYMDYRLRPLPDQGDTDLRSRRQTYGRPLPQEPQNAEPSHRQAKHQTFRTHQAAFRDDDRTSARGSPSRRHRERAPSSRERSPFSRERTPPSRSPVRTFEERERTGRYRDRGHYTPPRRALVPEDNRDDMTPRTPVYSREPPPRRWASVYDDEMGSRRAPAYEPVYRSRSSRYEAEDGRGRMRAPREYYRTEPIYNRRSTDNRRDLEPLRRPVKREISPDLRFQEPPTERVSEDRLVLRPTSTDLERGESVRGRSWQQGPLYIDAPQPPWSYRGSSVHPELHPLIPYPTAPTWQPNSFQPQMVAHVQAPPLDSGYSRLTDYYAPPSQYPPTYARGQGDQVPALHSQNQYARPSQYRIRTQGNGEGSSRQR